MDTLVYTLFPAVPVIAADATEEQRESIKTGAGFVLDKAKDLANTAARIRVHNEAIDKLVELKDGLPQNVHILQQAFDQAVVQPGAIRAYFARETINVKQDKERFLLVDSFIKSVTELREKTRPKDVEEWNPRIVAATDPVVRRYLVASDLIKALDNVKIVDSVHIKIRGQIFMVIGNEPKEEHVADTGTFGTFFFAPEEVKELPMDAVPCLHPFFEDPENPPREFVFNYRFSLNIPVLKHIRVEGLQ